MSGLITKSVNQAIYTTAFVVIGAAFLSVGGIRIFANSAFATTGIAIIFLFFLFAVFITMNWK